MLSTSSSFARVNEPQINCAIFDRSDRRLDSGRLVHSEEFPLFPFDEELERTISPNRLLRQIERALCRSSFRRQTGKAPTL
jgi:hypothetical protein